jgi:predicted ribosomally synthesized peptide with SipW-like signal peptide
MKKIGLIALTLVIALGALGVGYAAWTDTVTITGNVNTGTVDLVVTRLCGTEVYKDLTNETMAYVHWASDPLGPKEYWDPIPDPGKLIGYADVTYPDDDTIAVEWNNLFPIPSDQYGLWGGWIANCRIDYTGTIPIKVQIDKTITGIPEAWVTITFYWFGHGLYTPEQFEGQQLHAGDAFEIWIIPAIPQLESAQGITNGYIEVVVTGIQWNEYVAPP